MYGDTDAIRGLARTMRSQASALHDEADTLLARADATPWEGLAAAAMRAQVRAQTHALHHTGELAEAAAEALDRHADEVDRLKRLIAAIEDKVMALVAAARDRLADLAGVVGGIAGAVLGGNPLDDVLDRFLPPPSGHRDWLTVDLPGLDLGGLVGR